MNPHRRLRLVGAGTTALRIGLAEGVVGDGGGLLEGWRAYLARRLDRDVRFVPRAGHAAIAGLFTNRMLDYAWIPAAPYVGMLPRVRLAAAPVRNGNTGCSSYLVASASDPATRSLLDLRGKTFACAAPESNPAYLFTRHRLLELKAPARGFFARRLFPHSHRNVVVAIGSGIASGGAIDGHSWEMLERRHPAALERTRIVERSPELPYPPFVARADMSAGELAAMQRALYEMTCDDEGRSILSRLELDRFEAADPRRFETVERMARALAAA